MYLELAEGARHMGPDFRKYIYFPPQEPGQAGIYLREDAMDNLSEGEFNKLMEDLEPFQTHTGLSARARKETRKQRREERKQIKTQKKAEKVAKKQSKTELRKAKAAAKIIRAEARKTRAEKAGSRPGFFKTKEIIDPETGEIIGTEPSGAQKAAGIFGKVLDTAGGIMGKKFGGGAGAEEPDEETAIKPKIPGGEKTPFYKNPLVIGGAAVLLIGGIILSRQKK